MNLKVLKKEEHELVAVIDKANPMMMNVVRRMILNEVPTLAVDEVTIKKNSSALYDEMLALRLGLLPLTTDLKTYKLQADCKCEGKGCAQCTVLLTLKAKGPGTVYASQVTSKDPDAKPVYGETPIVKLLQDQDVDVEMKAMLGQGKMHTKFSPGLAYYAGYPEIEGKKSALKNLPKAVQDKLAEKGDNLEVKNILSWTEADEETCEKHEIAVKHSEERFIFTIESWGQLKPKEILVKATDMFDAKLKEFTTKFKKLK